MEKSFWFTQRSSKSIWLASPIKKNIISKSEMEAAERRNLQNLEPSTTATKHLSNNENEIDPNNVVVDGRYSMTQDLILIQKLQYLLDILLEIRPLCDEAVVPLVLEAMDCVMIEVFDVYSRICNGIARILIILLEVEASMALRMFKSHDQAKNCHSISSSVGVWVLKMQHSFQESSKSTRRHQRTRRNHQQGF
ncbi:hypothetical protein HAX54_024811 [Datura stramonium]|uniref:AP180 N-terminal homology (ANTH) domain-containing protein n=1 Tax=Datura stramonium TaxID=4076 RepID=A0ABS8S658_DATST|nr:hypothetical protein [Datura stramonium]